jgi:hypothetical protein
MLLSSFWWLNSSFLPEKEVGHPCTALYHSTCCGNLYSTYQVQTRRNRHGVVGWSKRVLKRYMPY